MSAPATKKREIEGLLEAMKRFSLKEGLIITEHEEDTTTVEKDKIKYKIVIKPIWRWLLENKR
jgi:uncharacterized protein